MVLTLDQALQKGVKAHKAGKVQEADRYYTAILQAQPNHPDANHNMGVLAVGIGKIVEALPFFKSAIEANSSIAQFWLSYIDALIKLDRIDDAREVLNQAKSTCAEGSGLEQVEKKLGDLENSIEAGPAISKLKEPPSAVLHSILNLYTRGQYQEALMQASQILKQFPNSINLYNIVGATNRASGKLDEAIKAYKKALTIQPDYAEAYNNMGNALKEQGKLEEAIESFTRALELKPDYAEAYSNMGNVLKEQGKLGEAIDAYKKVPSIKPNNVTAYYNMGNALKEQGKLEEAIESFTRALELKPDYAEAYYGLAAILYERGDSTGVMENLGHVESYVPDASSDNKFLRLPYQILKRLKYNEMEKVTNLKKSKGLKNSNKFPLIIERNVEAKLVNCLYKLSARSLEETKDARYGSGRCSPDFKLFETEEPIIKKVATELLQSMEKLLDGKVLYHESFFNILGAGGGSNPHSHIKDQDLDFDLDQYKFSLVYYLSVGDQNCTEPGTLKLYEPDIDILPTKGMCVLIPASRKHSAIYNGTKDRLMIGCNFYLV